MYLGEANVQAIVNWVYTCNKKGMAVNYESWTTSNYTKEADRLLQEIGRDEKEIVTKKKATDELADMMKSSKNMKKITNYTG